MNKTLSLIVAHPKSLLISANRLFVNGPGTQPIVVFIMADDMGYGDVYSHSVEFTSETEVEGKCDHESH